MQNKQADELIKEINLSKIENKKKEVGNFVFIPTENKNGFLVYLNSKITNDIWFKTKEQKDRQNNNGRKYNTTLKDLENFGENYTCRYYYYETLQNNYKNNHITIIMINPAFAYSKKLDRTIHNIQKKLKEFCPEISSFDILNISPIRNPYTDAFVQLEKNYNLYNKEMYKIFFSKMIGSRNKIILAWGNTVDKIDINRNRIFDELKGKNFLYTLEISNNNNPMHLSPLNNKFFNWKQLKHITLYKDKNDKFKVKICP